MKTPRCTGLLGLALASLLLALPAQAARLALVIGNDAYTVFRPLRNAVQDARDVALELRSAGFEVPAKWVVTNGTRRQMDAAVQDFISRIGPADEVVFYYSGHGVEIDSQAALVPVDLSDPAYRPLDKSVRPLSELAQAKQQVLHESITLNQVAADIAAKDVKFSLLIVDACRDNPVLELLKAAHAANPAKSAAGPAPMAGLIVDSNADSQVLLFSASKGQQSLDRLNDADPVKNGVFTRVLLKAMRTPGMGLRDMLPKIKTEVKAMAATVKSNGQPHQQQPRSMAAFDAPDFYFRPASQQFVPVVQQDQSPAPRPPIPSAGQVFKDCAECPEMVVIPAGSFQMGSNDKDSEKPIHTVNIKSFAMSKYEVTQGQWKSVMGSNPSYSKKCGDNCPVEHVSWNDVQRYIQKVKQKTGENYRLPSEAEWEYAARSGSSTQYSWGNDIGHNNANCNGCDSQWEKEGMAPVGQYKPNGFGLFDMHGNVSEWVEDCWHKNYDAAPSNEIAWTTGCHANERVLRGGSASTFSEGLRSYKRGAYIADDSVHQSMFAQTSIIGFRLARTVQ